MGTGDVDQQCCCLQVRIVESVAQTGTHFCIPSMWPLLKRDGLGIQYVALTVLWNAALGYTPFKRPKTFAQSISLVSDSVYTGTSAERPALPIGCLGWVHHPSPPGIRHPTTSSIPRPVSRIECPGQHPGLWIGLVVVNKIRDRSRLGDFRPRGRKPGSSSRRQKPTIRHIFLSHKHPAHKDISFAPDTSRGRWIPVVRHGPTAFAFIVF